MLRLCRATSRLAVQSVTPHQIMLSAALTFWCEHCTGVLLLVVFVSTLHPGQTPLDR